MKFREKRTLLKIKLSICHLVIIYSYIFLFLRLVTKKPGFHYQLYYNNFDKIMLNKV